MFDNFSELVQNRAEWVSPGITDPFEIFN